MLDIQHLFDLTGRTAVVTGASSGLGITFAETLVDAGANVVLAARRAERLEELAGRIEAAGGRACAVSCDIVDPDQTEALMAQAVDTFGSVDVVVANAGVVAEGGAVPEQVKPELFARTVEVNLAGTFHTCQAAGRRMLAGGSGSIITVASVAGLGASFEAPGAYSASKAATISLTKDLALRWGDRGVRVNSIAPGWFPSEMTDVPLSVPPLRERIEGQTALRRVGTPKELAGALLLLASDAGSYMTGTVISVDGGQSASFGTSPYPDMLYAGLAERVPDGMGVRIMPEGG